jgi:hypothetical protein
MIEQPPVAEVIEAALDVAFQNPDRRVAAREAHEATFDCICATTRRPESVRGVVRRGFRDGVEGEQV